MSKVTLQDIADALGISRNTVSKAINQSDGIAESTREKILQKAIEMGYKQFSYVSMLTKASQMTDPAPATPKEAGVIALLTTNLFSQHHHFGILMLDRFTKELSQLGYRTETHIIDKETLVQCLLPPAFHPQQVNGILCVEMLDRAYGEMLCKLGLPLLLVDGPADLTGHPLATDQLLMENVSGITQIVQNMLAQGKRRIGFIGNYRHCQSFYERYAAFRMAMLLGGAPVEDKFCITQATTQEQNDRLNSLTEMPDLFLCANDFVAMGAIQTLRKRGIFVPKHVLFAGFDDAPESRILTPTLTTIHIHSQSMAFNAVQLLLSRIEEPSLDYRVVHTETTLIYRDSTTPPKGSSQEASL